MLETITGIITSIIGLIRKRLGFSASINDHDVALYD